MQDAELPLVYVGVFIEKATPFMDEFLERLTTLNYPMARIRLFIHNNVGRRSTQLSPLFCLRSDPLKPSHRLSTTSATSRSSGSGTELCFPTRSWWDLRRTSRRTRPGTWPCEWSGSTDECVDVGKVCANTLVSMCLCAARRVRRILSVITTSASTRTWL